MLQKLVDFALRNRLAVLAAGVVLLIWGAISFRSLPVEAYPDVANNYVNVITQWPGRAAEEVEQQVTIPIEVQMNGLPHLMALRSQSLFGLSSLMMIFDDDSNNDLNRTKVLERLSQVTLPNGLQPALGPDYSPVGQIYFYTLKSTNPAYDVMELKSLQDWVLAKQLKSVPDVVDVSAFGGTTREYQVQIDPNQLVSYGLNIAQVEQALANNNTNAGGSFIQRGAQSFNVRALGLMQNPEDIGETVLKTQNGIPVRVRDVAAVTQGPKIRLGQLGKAVHLADGTVLDNPDAVSGIVLLRKGANADAVLAALHQKVDFLNNHFLPPGVKIIPHLDRSDLVHLTTHTVLHNLTEGIFLVALILFIFLGNIRGAFIVTITIPFSLLFASICLDLRHIPANLLSLGALDFGMIVEGAILMVENIVRILSKQEDGIGGKATVERNISGAAHEVQRPVFYAITIIIIAYLPIFTLQQVEGRLFKPMAWTVAFALLGGLLFSMFLAPVLASIVFPKGTREWHNPLMNLFIRAYRRLLEWAIGRRYVTVSLAALSLAGALLLARTIGSEFLPHLDEGAIWARGTLAPSAGPSEGIRIMNQARIAFAKFPEVTQVVSQVGRPDDGTDTSGFSNTEYFIDLKPKEQWRPEFHQNKTRLIEALNGEAGAIPGVVWNFSQPIADNMEEAVSGVKGELAVKIYGADLKLLEEKGDEIVRTMSKVRGVSDLGLFRVIGQPNVNLVVNRKQADRYGINVSDIQDAIETAVAGKAVSEILKGEERYDLVVRYQPQYRGTIDQIKQIRLAAPGGERVSLGQLCDVNVTDGASAIYREDNSRYVALKYSVLGRDLGSTVEEAMSAVQKSVKLPPGYRLEWAGEYESAKRSQRRLAIIIPLTLLLIFMVLYSMFSSVKWASLILLNVAMAPIGGIVALYLSGANFSVSSGVGFLALFGVSVQTGVILVEYINQLRSRGYTILKATSEGAVLRFRPILMTMLVASLGLVPAATSHGIGSDSQRPFAIVIVGGLIAALLISIFLLPAMYVWFAREGDALPAPDPHWRED
ncbi:MAG TPA: CusA/CzcA family heavy metal efflux RND transporter [Bryobacteraceae bacterium]|nr:CusA/CzcA family heavy metal efflux RND transporter [Bryobacteraceae bacterium]